MSAEVLRDARFRDVWRRVVASGTVSGELADEAVLDALSETAARFASRMAEADAKAEEGLSLEAVDELKADANALFRDGRFLDAAMAYGRALAVCPAGGPRAVLLANRSAALVECRRFDDAEKDARLAVRLRPSYGKGWARLGEALAGQRRDADAVVALERALSLDSGLSRATELLAEVSRRSGRQA